MSSYIKSLLQLLILKGEWDELDNTVNNKYMVLKRMGQIHVYIFIVRTYVIHLLGTYVTTLCNWLIL